MSGPNPYEPPASAIAKPPRQERTGQIITTAVAIGFVASELIVSLRSEDGIRVVRLALTVLLGFFLARGAGWARGLVVALHLGVVPLGVALVLWKDELPPDPSRLATIGFSLICAGLLTVPGPVRRFFAAARER